MGEPLGEGIDSALASASQEVDLSWLPSGVINGENIGFLFKRGRQLPADLQALFLSEDEYAGKLRSMFKRWISWQPQSAPGGVVRSAEATVAGYGQLRDDIRRVGYDSAIADPRAAAVVADLSASYKEFRERLDKLKRQVAIRLADSRSDWEAEDRDEKIKLQQQVIDRELTQLRRTSRQKRREETEAWRTELEKTVRARVTEPGARGKAVWLIGEHDGLAVAKAILADHRKTGLPRIEKAWKSFAEAMTVEKWSHDTDDRAALAELAETWQRTQAPYLAGWEDVSAYGAALSAILITPAPDVRDARQAWENYTKSLDELGERISVVAEAIWEWAAESAKSKMEENFTSYFRVASGILLAAHTTAAAAKIAISAAGLAGVEVGAPLVAEAISLGIGLALPLIDRLTKAALISVSAADAKVVSELVGIEFEKTRGGAIMEALDEKLEQLETLHGVVDVFKATAEMSEALAPIADSALSWLPYAGLVLTAGGVVLKWSDYLTPKQQKEFLERGDREKLVAAVLKAQENLRSTKGKEIEVGGAGENLLVRMGSFTWSWVNNTLVPYFADHEQEVRLLARATNHA